MRTITRRSLIASIGAASLAGPFIVAAEAQETKALVNTTSTRDRIRARHFPNLLLTTHEGKKVRFYDDLLKDKIVVINFMYVKCERVCPGITANLAKLQKLLGSRLGRDIFMYSFTLKPEQDSPEVLRKYAEAYHAKEGWTFLTGTPEDMELLRRKLGFTDPDPRRDADKSNHIGNIRYGNEPLQLWGSCPGLSKASWIAESISWVDWPKAAKGERK
ncbi:MAG TPA: SCO family protein [Pyrinomonadaceae bacterium]|jgi:protein SCO1/2|nr:SCO family protein [Pyrinomonadaceae bacterium]